MAMGVPTSGGRRRGGRGRRAPMAEINVTPFVDVMLVLLVIFMVTAPLLVAGVPINLPDSRAKPVDSEQPEPIQLSINAEGQIFIDEIPVENAALPARLQALAAAETGREEPRQIRFRADRSLDHGRVMRVLGEINRAGLTRIALVTSGSDGEE
ncbi:MAG: ExbD/TolR family protein [Sphingopyxis sp.]|nr:ExbD/TolR family protein [Sphingopyxis sp.]